MDFEDKIAEIFIIIAIIAVIALKITGVITLSWFWLLCPIWGLFSLGCVLAVIFLIAFGVGYVIDKLEKRNVR